MATKAEKSTQRAAVVAELKRKQAAARRRSRVLMATAVVTGAAIIIAAFVAIGLTHGPGPSQKSTVASAAVVAGVTRIPAATFDAVGKGTSGNGPTAIKAAALTAGGKPRVLYVGAEYCPFCAAERWAVVAALSRFGTFSHLGQTASAHGDVYPDTSTLSFHGATYTSDYLSFTGIEQTTNQLKHGSYTPLDKISAVDEKLLDTYDFPPYVSASSKGSIPFIDLGGSAIVSGAGYSPQLLAGMSHEQIADALKDPDSKVAQAVDGAANTLTATLCKLTDGKPGSVCTSAGVVAAG